jgi:hypothetical protein
MPTPLQIKTLIKEISGLHGDPANIQGTTTLNDLGFTAAMCIYLENRISELKGAVVPAGSVSPGSTVDQVIALSQ